MSCFLNNSLVKRLFYCLFVICLILCGTSSFAQTNGNIPNNPKSLKDTSKTNTNKWLDEDPKITYERLDSKKTYAPDSELHTFHRAPFIQPWSRDLGNLGSPSNNLLFTPDNRVGPSLGYHIFDGIRFNVDSLKFYNTARPLLSLQIPTRFKTVKQ